MRISPDGRFAVISMVPSVVPAEWDKYTDPYLRGVIALYRDPGTREASGLHAQQLFVFDLRQEKLGPLWDAPIAMRPSVEWLPDGDSVRIGPTFLPVALADAAGLAGTATAEINLANGHIKRSEEKESGARNSAHAFRIEIRENPNTPPVLYAVEAESAKERVILDPNPWLLSTFELGRAQRIAGESANGRPWGGRIYYPTHYRPGKRYPLVIQLSATHPAESFSLFGRSDQGLGPSGSVYASQILANRQIAVLDLANSFNRYNFQDATRDWGETVGTAYELQIERTAIDAAVRHLAQIGLVDPAKVGLAGFSRSGWYVEYALTHSETPFAAALVSDNMDGGYLQEMFDGLPHGGLFKAPAPAGAGLEEWLSVAPGFNANRVRTPLRLQVEHIPAGILCQWEMFSQLRRLKKPVELYVIPDIDHGHHGPQNPAQALALKEAAVDWFDFWLNEHESSAPEKHEQYVRWRKLRQLYEADARKPRPALLKWKAVPMPKEQSGATSGR